VSPEFDRLYSEVTDELGSPFVPSLSRKNDYSVNQSFFARVWSRVRIAVYETAEDAFYTYNPENGLYEFLSPDRVKELVASDIRTAAEICGTRGTVGGKITANLMASILAMVRQDTHARKSGYFKPPFTDRAVIHMVVIGKDGSVKLEPFSPEFRSRNQVQVNYSRGAECPRFRGELLEPIMNADDIEMFQRFWGLVLIGGNRSQKFLILSGEGGVGKGTMIGVLTLLIGERNVYQLRPALLTKRFELSNVAGKSLFADFLQRNQIDQLVRNFIK
jgi:hypothetical protein